MEESPRDILFNMTEISAVMHTTPNYPPTYLCHGLNDTTVPYNQSVMMADALQLVHVNYELALVPGANHAFDYNATRKQWLEYILPAFTFVEQYLTSNQSTIHI